jgi:hypothetical protein
MLKGMRSAQARKQFLDIPLDFNILNSPDIRFFDSAGKQRPWVCRSCQRYWGNKGKRPAREIKKFFSDSWVFRLCFDCYSC